jgi:hypothetical protein
MVAKNIVQTLSLRDCWEDILCSVTEQRSMNRFVLTSEFFR